VAAEVGSSGGDGVNKIAILDPNASQPDPHPGDNSNIQVMKRKSSRSLGRRRHGVR